MQPLSQAAALAGRGAALSRRGLVGRPTLGGAGRRLLEDCMNMPSFASISRQLLSFFFFFFINGTVISIVLLRLIRTLFSYYYSNVGQSFRRY